MPPEDTTHSGRIDNTAEWRLIYGLCQNKRHFVVSRSQYVVGSKKTHELSNAIRYLDVQIRRTFTILSLDVLLYLESETEDNESQTSSESDSMSPPNELLGSLDHYFPLSADEALSRLRKLCSLLEARVNRLLIPSKPGDSDQSRGYPRLTQLVEHFKSLSPSHNDLEFIPCPGSTPTQFLFNIADDTDTATADAFVAFTDLSQRRPCKKVRQCMLKNAKDLSQDFLSFNSFVDKLQFSVASLDDLTTQSSESSTSNQSFPTFALLQKFRRQIAAAYRVILSHVSSCTDKLSMKHRILLQLPGWGDFSKCDSRNMTESLPVQLFFTMCPRNDWQIARMSFLLPEHTKTCKQRKLYRALSDSYYNDNDLEFYVSEDYKGVEHGEILVQVPRSPNRTRIYSKSLPNHEDSLLTLIKRGHFAKEQTMDLLYSTSGAGTIIGIDQRKALAIKLVLGLMMSIDSDEIFKSWDPKHIHFLDPVDTEYTPFVSIPGNEDSANRGNRLSLAGPSPCSSLDEDVDDLKPLPQFVLLAKVLSQIAVGAHLDEVELSNKSQHSVSDAWKKLRSTVVLFIQRAACGSEVNREALPFLQAALGCLDFHLEYQNREREVKLSEKIDIAWKLVFDNILVKIDGNLTLEGLIKSSTDVPTKEDYSSAIRHSVLEEASAIHLNTSSENSLCTADIEKTRIAPSSSPNVQLFDTTQTVEASTANEFWTRLEKFHRSYSRFVLKRSEKSGSESPRRIRIAVLDTGIDFDHSAITEARDKGRMKKEWYYSWVGDPAHASDVDDLHGTNCAYLLHKVAPEADIYVGKVFGQNALRLYEAKNIAKAIDHASNVWDVDIISMSFGLRRPTTPQDVKEYERIVEDIETAILNAATSNKPRIMFAAASNNGKNEPRAFPAKCHPWVICVHASEGSGKDGGINPKMENGLNFMTLGMGIELMEREWDYKAERKFPKYKIKIKSGTSFATPIAGGIAAAVLDLAERVEAINIRAKNKLRRPEGMQVMLQNMSIPKGDVRDQMYYVAPWHHWDSGWETRESDGRWYWDTINKLYES